MQLLFFNTSFKKISHVFSFLITISWERNNMIYNNSQVSKKKKKISILAIVNSKKFPSSIFPKKEKKNIPRQLVFQNPSTINNFPEVNRFLQQLKFSRILSFNACKWLTENKRKIYPYDRILSRAFVRDLVESVQTSFESRAPRIPAKRKRRERIR